MAILENERESQVQLNIGKTTEKLYHGSMTFPCRRHGFAKRFHQESILWMPAHCPSYSVVSELPPDFSISYGFFSFFVYIVERQSSIKETMIDISKKVSTLRTAIATATLSASPATIQALRENKLPKGDPLPVAKVAAVQAAKNTSQLIPYCHPIPLDFVACRFEVGADRIEVTTEVKATYKTGVEMEALVAASAAVLTLYDMMKAVDENMQILGVKLVKKTGGKSDYAQALGKTLKAAVLVSSDSVASGKREDTSGKLIVERLKREGFEIADFVVVPDDVSKIEEKLRTYANEMKLSLVLTSGGTGLGPRDNTPEATARIIEREVPGITEVLRAHGQNRTPLSMLSRGKAGVCGQTIIINLPGSPRGVTESLDALFPWLLHAFKMMEGEGH